MKRQLSWIVLVVLAVAFVVVFSRRESSLTAARPSSPGLAIEPSSSGRDLANAAAESEARKAITGPVTPTPVAEPAKTEILTVESGTSSPLPDVEVTILGEQERTVAGHTDEQGRLVLASQSIAGAKIALRALDHVVETRTVPDPAPRALTVELRSGCPLRGRVVAKASGEPVAGVTVVAARDQRLPSCAVLSDLTEANPLALSAKSAFDGTFEIRGTDPGFAYWLRAAGAGCISKEPVSVESCASDEIQLEVITLYALDLTLREQGGGPLKTNQQWIQLSALDVQCLDRGVTDMNLNVTDIGLLGYSPQCLQMPQHRRFLIYATEDQRDYVIRIVARFNIAGYKPMSAVLKAPRLTEAVHEQVLELTPIANGWGDLCVEFVGVPSTESGTVTTDGAHYWLELESDSGEHASLTIWDSLESRTYQGIPYGGYRARLVGGFGLYKAGSNTPPAAVVIGPTPAHVSFDLGGTGGLLLTVLDEDKSEVDGFLAVQFHNLTKGGYYSVEFLQRPYFIPCINPGDYEVSANPTVHLEPPGAERLRESISIRPGETTKLTLAYK